MTFRSSLCNHYMYIDLIFIHVDSYRADWNTRTGLFFGVIDLPSAKGHYTLRAKGGCVNICDLQPGLCTNIKDPNSRSPPGSVDGDS